MFRWTKTYGATEKDQWTLCHIPVNDFIQTFIKCGHREGEKGGTGIIAAVFRTGTRLEQKNVEVTTGLILDIDGKFKKDGKAVFEVVDPNWLIGLLPYRGVAHTSFNHSPAHPKYRVILPLAEELTPEQHHRLWWWIFDHIQRKCDPSCKNPDRMFYLPRCPAEAIADKTPWIRELHGPLLSITMVPEEYEPEEIHLGTYVTTEKQGGHFAAPDSVKYPKTDVHALLNSIRELPLVQWAITDATEVSREVWRGIATNIAAAVTDDESAQDDAAALFHEISEEDPDRYDWNVTQRTFRDALKSAREYGPMTFETMKINGAPDGVCDSSWVKSPVAQARRCIAPKRVGSPSPKNEASVAEVSQAAEAAEVPSVDVPVDIATEIVAADPSSLLGPDKKNDAVWGGNSEEEGQNEKKDTIFDHKSSDFLYDMQNTGWLIWDAARKTWSEPYTDAAFNQRLLSWGIARKNMDGYRNKIKPFARREPVFNSTQQLVKVGDMFVFNTYHPGDVVPCPGDWSIYQYLLRNLVGDNAAALEYVLDHTAAPLQSLRNKGQPWKLGTSNVFRGDQGSGKGTFGRVLTLLYGRTNVITVGQAALDGRFNGELLGKLFVVANEVISNTNRSEETANKIKMWVTDDVIPVERKHKELEQVPNYFNICFTANGDRPVLIERHDRRFSVFNSKKLPGELTTQIYDDLTGDKSKLAAFYDHLLKREVHIKYGDLFMTAERDKMIRSSMPSWEKFIYEIQEDGWLAVSDPWHENAPAHIPRQAVVGEDKSLVLVSTMQEVYRDFCTRNGVKPGSEFRLTAALRTIPNVDQTRQRLGGVQYRLWTHIPMHPADAEVITLPTPVVVAASGGAPSDNAEL